MNKSDFHNNQLYNKNSTLPILNKLIELYKQWQEFLSHFPKTSRYTLGSKIDSLIIATIEFTVIAVHTNRENKLTYLEKAATKLDMLKFFLQIAWQIKALDNKKYLAISRNLDELGRMLGGWLKSIKNKLPPD